MMNNYDIYSADDEVFLNKDPKVIGYNAYWDGSLKAENPYIDGTDDFNFWNEGWDRADAEYDLEQRMEDEI